MTIGLIPLDERPVNSRYPALIGAVADWDVQIPPLDILSAYRKQADLVAIAEWL
jgi:hypothetical protein